MLGAAAIVVASLETEDEVAVVAVLETDILRSDSEVFSVAVIGVAVTEGLFFPKKAAGNEDSRAAWRGVIGVEEVGGEAGGEDFDDLLNIFVVVGVENNRYSSSN